jgi:hypothetical protein
MKGRVVMRFVGNRQEPEEHEQSDVQMLKSLQVPLDDLWDAYLVVLCAYVMTLHFGEKHGE